MGTHPLLANPGRGIPGCWQSPGQHEGTGTPAAPGCHYRPVCHVAISVTERNDSSHEKALAEVINERFYVFLENCSISGMT